MTRQSRYRGWSFTATGDGTEGKSAHPSVLHGRTERRRPRALIHACSQYAVPPVPEWWVAQGMYVCSCATEGFAVNAARGRARSTFLWLGQRLATGTSDARGITKKLAGASMHIGRADRQQEQLYDRSPPQARRWNTDRREAGEAGKMGRLALSSADSRHEIDSCTTRPP